MEGAIHARVVPTCNRGVAEGVVFQQQMDRRAAIGLFLAHPVWPPYRQSRQTTHELHRRVPILATRTQNVTWTMAKQSSRDVPNTLHVALGDLNRNWTLGSSNTALKN